MDSADAPSFFTPAFLVACPPRERAKLFKEFFDTPSNCGWKVLQRLLDGASSLPRDIFTLCVSVPFLSPALCLGRFGKAPEDLLPQTPSAVPVDCFLGALHDFGFCPKQLRNTIRLEKEGSISQSIGRYYADLVPLAQTDAVTLMRVRLDVGMRRITRSFLSLLVREGGAQCRAWLARPDIYAGTDVRRESLAVLAVSVFPVNWAIAVLTALEKETPGFLKTVVDAAGDNLLWYMAYRSRIWIYPNLKRVAYEPSVRPGKSDGVRDLLLRAGCDPDARNVFGVSWEEARPLLAL